MDHKCKCSSECMPARLFYVEQGKVTYSGNSVEKRNQVYVFKGNFFKNGLMEKAVHPINLSHRNVAVTQSELDFFQRSGDERVIKALDAGVTPLQIGDRIQAITGTFRGLIGHVIDIHDDHTVTFQSVDHHEKGTSEKTRFPICSSEVRKKFELGDHVQVLLGAHSGDQGYIVEIKGEDAIVYKRCHGVVIHEEPGSEVSSSLAVCLFVPRVDALLDNSPHASSQLVDNELQS